MHEEEEILRLKLEQLRASVHEYRQHQLEDEDNTPPELKEQPSTSEPSEVLFMR